MQKPRETFRLTRKQSRAIVELLNPDNKSNIDIAGKLNVSERTLYNWLSDPNFMRSLEEERRKWEKKALNNFKGRFIKASMVLDELMGSKDEAIKLRTCLDSYEFPSEGSRPYRY